MPLPTPVAGTFEVFLAGRDGSGNYAANTSHWFVNNPPPDLPTAFQQALSLAAQFHTNIVTPSLLPMLGNDCALNVLFARHVGVGGGSAAYISFQDTGTAASNSFSSVVAVDIAWLPGGETGRAGHWFQWGVPSDEVIGAQITPAYRTLVDAFGALMLTNITAGPDIFELVVLTRKTGHVTPQTAFNMRSKLTGLNKRSNPFV